MMCLYGPCLRPATVDYYAAVIGTFISVCDDHSYGVDWLRRKRKLVVLAQSAALSGHRGCFSNDKRRRYDRGGAASCNRARLARRKLIVRR